MEENGHFVKITERERRTSATGVLETNHGFSVALRADAAPCWYGFTDAVNNVARCWKKYKN